MCARTLRLWLYICIARKRSVRIELLGHLDNSPLPVWMCHAQRHWHFGAKIRVISGTFLKDRAHACKKNGYLNAVQGHFPM